MIEVWRDIPGYEGLYELSSLGRLRSFKRGLCRMDWSGPYVSTTLRRAGVQRKFGLHVLLLMTFVGSAEGRWGCHRDDDKRNNALGNLYWGTPKENGADRVRNGNSQRGEKSPHAKISAELCSWIRESPQSSLRLAPVLGLASSTIRAIRIGQNWRGV